MAFTGTATVTKITDNCYRITGLSLAGDASGVIVFSDRAVIPGGAVEFGPAPDWQPYELSGTLVGLQSSVEVRLNVVTDVTTPVPISVVKAGTTHDDFSITLHNDTAATASGELEIYIERTGR